MVISPSPASPPPVGERRLIPEDVFVSFMVLDYGGRSSIGSVAAELGRGEGGVKRVLIRFFYNFILLIYFH